jgi:hypothetical protein
MVAHLGKTWAELKGPPRDGVNDSLNPRGNTSRAFRLFTRRRLCEQR